MIMTRGPWTTRQRALALLSVSTHINLSYTVTERWPNVDVIEAGVHELAHAVSLGMKLGGPIYSALEHLTIMVETLIAEFETRAGFHDYVRADHEEERALAIAWLVLRGLRLPGGHLATLAAAHRDHVDPRARMRRVRRLMRQHATQRRARRVRRLLDQLCAAWITGSATPPR